MSDKELTIAMALRDPIIRQVLNADKIPLSEFASLLHDASARMSNGCRHHEHRGGPFAVIPNIRLPLGMRLGETMALGQEA